MIIDLWASASPGFSWFYDRYVINQPLITISFFTLLKIDYTGDEVYSRHLCTRLGWIQQTFFLVVGNCPTITKGNPRIHYQIFRVHCMTRDETRLCHAYPKIYFLSVAINFTQAPLVNVERRSSSFIEPKYGGKWGLMDSLSSDCVFSDIALMMYGTRCRIHRGNGHIYFVML